MKVTSSKTISFSHIDWGINKGKTRSLPEDKMAQEIILAHPAISEAKKTKPIVEGKEKKTLETK